MNHDSRLSQQLATPPVRLRTSRSIWLSQTALSHPREYSFASSGGLNVSSETTFSSPRAIVRGGGECERSTSCSMSTMNWTRVGPLAQEGFSLPYGSIVIRNLPSAAPARLARAAQPRARRTEPSQRGVSRAQSVWSLRLTANTRNS